MLKTTTETGDIGIFSIGPKLPSPATYHQPPRPRRRLKDINFHPPRQIPKHDERDALHDDRKWLPSYRDTTSEIISLYGSDTQRSYPPSFSPSIEDSRRSYSLTTCSSQILPSHKSFATYHSYSSSGDAPRPRSPFPYPTRLRRPGLRAGSPALTDNGAVDYGRNGQYDQASQRTPRRIHTQGASINHRYPHSMRLRPDANRSTSSLPTRATTGPYHDTGNAARARTPGSLSSWAPSPYNRPRRGSNDQSIRTTSLTSIVEMYQDPANTPVDTQLRTMGSFYYDYSEGFENHRPTIPTMPETVCPIPQRSNSVARPRVLSDDLDEALRSSPVPGASSSTERYSDESAALGSSTCLPTLESEDDQCPCPAAAETCEFSNIDSESLFRADLVDDHHDEDEVATRSQAKTPTQAQVFVLPSDDCSVAVGMVNSVPATQVHQVAVTTPPNKIIDIQRPVADTNNAPYVCNTWSGDRSTEKAAVNPRASTTGAARLRNSLDPALAEFASMYASFDRLARSPFSKVGDDTFITNAGQTGKSGRRWPFRNKKRSQVDASMALTAGQKKSFRGKPERIADAAKVTMPDDVFDSTSPQEGNPRTGEVSRTPLQEFFASHGLRNKASAPQLMKPLPPLPAEAYMNADPNARVYVSESSRSGVPRLRLRARAPKTAQVPITATALSSVDEGSTAPPRTDSAHSRPKLRLKLSRAYLGLGSASKASTVLRSPGLKQCNALAEFQHCTRHDLFAPRISVSDAFNPPTSDEKATSAGPVDQDGETARPSTSPQPSDQFDIPYPPTVAMESESPGPQKRSSHNPNIDESESGGQQNRRLRQKISMLRLRMAGSHLARRHQSTNKTPLLNIQSLSSLSLRIADAESKDAVMNTEAKEKEDHDKSSGRVKRWATNARHAVRLYVKKRLDRNSRNASH